MCRYAFKTYKPHYACFNCRKTFKRRLMNDIEDSGQDKREATCPQCGELMADMGLDFVSPKKNDEKAWKHLKDLYIVGITYHSCGCGGPGYIPKNREQLIDYFNQRLNDYQKQLEFYRKRTEPSNESEIQREKSKAWDNINRIPYELRKGKGVISNENAKQFWIGRIKEVEARLKMLMLK